MGTNTKRNSILVDLEKYIANFVGTKYAIACSSARGAIRFALLALKIGKGDEVIIPDYTCQILPITVFCTGAKPKFCDIDTESLAISPEHISKVLNHNTKAIIFVQPYGLPVDPSPIIELTQERDITFIEDAAQAIGARINNNNVGSNGDLSILNFNKFLNVDLGGAVTTNNREIYNKIKLIQTKLENKPILTSLGYRLIDIFRLRSRKYMKSIFLCDRNLSKRTNEILTKNTFQLVNGWVTSKQQMIEPWRTNSLTKSMITQLMAYDKRYHHRRKLENLEIISLRNELNKFKTSISVRRKIANIFDKHIITKHFKKIIIKKNSFPSYLKYPILYHDKDKRLKCIKDLTKAGYVVDCLYRPLHMSPFFKMINNETNYKGSISVANQIIPLPIEPNMNYRTIENIISIVNSN